MTDQKTQQGHQMRVGDRAHRIIALALRSNLPDARGQRALSLARIAREVFAEYPIEYRPREAFLDAVTAAGVYLHRFRPESPSRFLGAEVVLDRARVDVVHELTSGAILIDEIKLGMDRHLASAVRSQIVRYLEQGSRTWGSRFAGVRLCTVHQPAQSTLYTVHDRKGSLIVASPLAVEVGVR